MDRFLVIFLEFKLFFFFKINVFHNIISCRALKLPCLNNNVKLYPFRLVAVKHDLKEKSSLKTLMMRFEGPMF